jgi:CubicO group peptidase (beta-lactamase class C family)
MLQRKYPVALLFFLIFLFFVNSSKKQDKISEFNEVLSTLHEYNLFNGVVLVARGDEIIYKEAFGKANFEWDVHHTTDSRFQIASITKTFTACLTMQFIEMGLLRLDDVITDHLTDYPSKTGDIITIKHLLEQSSGIPDYLNDPEFLKYDALLEHGRYELPNNYFAELELEFEPGTDWNYGNSGYYLLGLIIEQISGMTYEEALQKYIIEPSGLTDTGYASSFEIIEGLASGYVSSPVGFQRAPSFHSSAGFSAGMMYSTATDIFKWSRALIQGRLFPENQLQKMLSHQIEDYGYGIFLGEQRIGNHSELVISSFGNMPGYSSHLSYFAESDYTLIIMDNTQQCTNSIFFSLRDIIFQQSVPQIREPGSGLLASIIEERGVEEAVEYFWELNKTRAGECDFSIQEFMKLSEFYLEKEHTETAIQILELAAVVYPNSSMIRDKLSELVQ